MTARLVSEAIVHALHRVVLPASLGLIAGDVWRGDVAAARESVVLSAGMIGVCVAVWLACWSVLAWRAWRKREVRR